MLTDMRPIDYFRGLIAEAIANQKVETKEIAEFYISALLSEFVAAKSAPAEPLAISYLKALGSDHVTKERALKQLGDLALFVSGFFSDSLARKIVDVDYYVTMGSASYGHLADTNRGAVELHDLFSELSGKFTLFVDVLAEVSERSRLTSASDILRIYEKWLKTGSPRSERLLRDLGIVPLEVPTRPMQ